MYLAHDVTTRTVFWIVNYPHKPTMSLQHVFALTHALQETSLNVTRSTSALSQAHLNIEFLYFGLL